MTVQARVDRIRSIALGGPRAPESADFYSKVWGLETLSSPDDEAYLRGTGAEHHILALRRCPTRRIVRIELGAPDRAAVDALHARTVALGARTLGAPFPLRGPGGGYGFELIDPENRVVLISADVTMHANGGNVPGRPTKISHVVLNSPDIEAAQKFYGDVLGFVVSDRSEEQMVFIRCNNNRHHEIAFNRAEYSSLNHIAYEMPSFDSVMQGVGRLKANDCPIGWGTGCHGIGNIMFAYFVDPNGFVIEYNFYVHPFDTNAHQAKTWPRSPEVMDSWGTAGLPSAQMRRAMAGTPDPGFPG